MDIRRGARRWGVGMGLALALALGGCGNSSESQTPAPRQGPTDFFSLSRPPGRSARGFCGRATVAVGKGPRILKITAWCAPTKVNRQVGFTLSRYAPADSTESPVPEPRWVKSVGATGPGAGASGPRCRPFHHGLFCGVAAHGPIQLHLTLGVPPRSRCHLDVSVIASFDDTCRNKPCVGALTTYSLFSGRPKGC